MKKLLLLVLLLTSCSTSPIDTFFSQTKSYTVNKSLETCPLVTWKEDIPMGSSLVTRNVATKCVQAYNVEYISDNDQVVKESVYQYRLTDYNKDVYILGRGKNVLDGKNVVDINTYIKGLRK